MSKFIIEVRKIDNYKIGVKIRSNDEDFYMKVVNALKKIISVRFDKYNRENIISIYYYKHLMKVLLSLPVELYLDPALEETHNKSIRRLEILPDISDFKYPTIWNNKQKLIDYQKEGVDICVKRRRYIIGDDMGTGKTPEAICIFAQFLDFGYERVLITCLSKLRDQWVNEIMKFTTLKREDITILGDNEHCFTGEVERCMLNSPVCKSCTNIGFCKTNKKGNTKIRVKSQLFSTDCKVFICGYETFRDYHEQIKKGGFDVFIFDEASKFKSVSTQIYRRIYNTLKNSKPTDVVIPMSGTLIENRVQEIYPIFSLVDENVFGTYDSFKWKFVVYDHFGSPCGVQNQKELKSVFQKFIIRRTLAEVWKDRPKFYSFVRECKMSPVQEKIYKQVEEQETENLRSDSGISKQECVAIIAHLTIAASSTEGMSDVSKGNHLEHSAKLDMFIEMIENEVDGKALLFCHFTKKVMPFIIAGLNKAKIKHLVLSPEVSNQEAVVKKFERDDSVRVLLCSDAVSYGINLQMANYVFHFDIPWNPSVADQRTARAYRREQKKPVTCVYLTTKNTIDEYILNTNYDKRNLFEMFFTPGLKVDNKHATISAKTLLSILDV